MVTYYIPTQLSHRLQCDALGGRNILQVKQYLSLTGWPRTRISCVLGGGLCVGELALFGTKTKKDDNYFIDIQYYVMEVKFECQQLYNSWSKEKINQPICFSIYAASSGVALGITPGSLKLVLNNVDITNRNIRAPTTGIAGVMRAAKNGQLKRQIMMDKMITNHL